jgi:hypothetical protein
MLLTLSVNYEAEINPVFITVYMEGGELFMEGSGELRSQLYLPQILVGPPIMYIEKNSNP